MPFEVSDKLSFNVSNESFEGSSLGFGDYIRLRGLKIGDVFHLTDGANYRTVIIGNGTPYEGIESTSHNGWDYALYNSWRILSVSHLHTQGGEFLGHQEIDTVRSMKQVGLTQ